MKIKLDIPYSHSVVIEADNDSGTLLKALSNAKLVTSEGYGKELVWKEAEKDKTITFEIVKDDFFVVPHDAIVKLTAENALTSKRWLEEYQAKNKVKTELEELKAKIATLGIELK